MQSSRILLVLPKILHYVVNVEGDAEYLARPLIPLPEVVCCAIDLPFLTQNLISMMIRRRHFLSQVHTDHFRHQLKTIRAGYFVSGLPANCLTQQTLLLVIDLSDSIRLDPGVGLDLNAVTQSVSSLHSSHDQRGFFQAAEIRRDVLCSSDCHWVVADHASQHENSPLPSITGDCARGGAGCDDLVQFTRNGSREGVGELAVLNDCGWLLLKERVQKHPEWLVFSGNEYFLNSVPFCI